MKSIIMKFSSFIKLVKSRIGDKNIDAQQFMAPFGVGDRGKELDLNPNPRLSAVFILIFNKADEAYISLIERPKYDGVHSGQIALPGGAKDKEDKNLSETALRELYEEIGIPKSAVTVLGELSNVYIPPSKFLVSPFIGVTSTYPNFQKDDYEVEQVIEVPISLLFDDAIVKSGTVPVNNGQFKMKVPYFDIYGHKVWGATAIILSEFKAIFQ